MKRKDPFPRISSWQIGRKLKQGANLRSATCQPAIVFIKRSYSWSNGDHGTLSQVYLLGPFSLPFSIHIAIHDNPAQHRLLSAPPSSNLQPSCSATLTRLSGMCEPNVHSIPSHHQGWVWAFWDRIRVYAIQVFPSSKLRFIIRFLRGESSHGNGKSERWPWNTLKSPFVITRAAHEIDVLFC